MGDRDEAELLDRLYAVAMEPERFAELVDVWRKRLATAQARGTLADETDLQHMDSHLARAQALVSLAQENPDALSLPLQDAMEAEPRAMLALDSQGHVRACNSAARTRYGDIEQHPLERLPFDDETKEDLRRRCRGISAATPEEPLTGELLRAGFGNGNTATLLSTSFRTTASGRTLMLVKSIDFVWPERWTPLIRDVFDLTPAETEVLQLLAEGHVPARIAELRGASLATVRSQVRAIYEKTGTHNQSEFMRLAQGLGSLEFVGREELVGIFPEPAASAPDTFPRPEDRRFLSRPGNRVMAYSDFGDPGGRCCLFMHNEFFGDVWRPEGVARAAELGLRIVAPARPCYGGSTCPDGRPVRPDTVSDDIVALLDVLGIDRAVPMFQMAGGIVSLDLATRYPERIPALAVVAPVFPIRGGQEEGKLPDFHAFLSSVIHRHPRFLEFICKSGMAYHDRVGTRRFIRTFARDHRADLALVDDDVIFSQMARGAEFCGVHGHRGFFNDYRHIPDDAFGGFASLEQPLVALIGDTLPERRNIQLHSLLAAHQRSEVHHAAGGAHYLHFSHPAEVADLVDRAWQLADET